MKKLLSFLLLALAAVFAKAEYYCRPYLDQNKIECVLTWNSKTGSSSLYYFDATMQEFTTSPYQLPENPTGDNGKIMMEPYLDNYGMECFLVWNETTGNSKLYFYSEKNKTISLAEYQIPSSPTGDAGKFEFRPYVDQYGIECFLVGNMTTGTSVLYFYKESEEKIVRADYQIPVKPTGDAGEYHFIPYLDQNGLECVLAYNSVTGTSVLFYYKSETKQFAKSKYQLDTAPTGDKGTFQFRPYLDQNGLECVLVYNSKTGSSALFYYQETSGKFVKANYQLPLPGLTGIGLTEFEPYLDADGLECVLECNSEVGTSVLHFYREADKGFVPAGAQLPILDY